MPSRRLPSGERTWLTIGDREDWPPLSALFSERGVCQPAHFSFGVTASRTDKIEIAPFPLTPRAGWKPALRF